MRDLWNIEQYSFCDSSVEFTTEREDIQYIFDACETYCKENIKSFHDYDVLIEGSKYNGVWLETQPLGGEMYAKRNMKIALANILIFMRYQRRDGKYPGMISRKNEWDGITPHFDWMQGCFLPYPALKMYYHLGKDRAYLQMVYDSLKDYDDYLWRYRDSTGNGVLENWCIWDVGEDNCTLHMLHGLKQPENGLWGKSTPPEDYGNMPHKSPQYMGYSYAIRCVLAEASRILENGEEDAWKEKAEFVRQKAFEYLWDKEKHAFFVRDRNGEFVYALTQENIKCMYCGLFTQEMADQFIREHLLNEEEFWTPYPLPAVAANSPYFHVNAECSNCADELEKSGAAAHDLDDNSWSGPLNGLIYQRSADALMRYHHHYETVLIGEKLINLLSKEKKFVQNYNPFTGDAANGMDGYGPTMLAALEYISILCGVNISCDKILWSCAPDMNAFTYTQNMYGHKYTLHSDGRKMYGMIDEKQVFSASCGVRIETDMQGKLLSMYGISEDAVTVAVDTDELHMETALSANATWTIAN